MCTGIPQIAHATIPQSFQRKSHLARRWAMSREDDFRIRPGRIRSRSIQRAKPFIAQALAAAQKAGGHVSRNGSIGAPRASRFGRGRVASVQAKPAADEPLASRDRQNAGRPAQRPSRDAQGTSQLSPPRGRHARRREGAHVRA